MDLQVEIKEEPVLCEGESDTSFENFELVSEIKPLKQETQSELTEPGPSQENAFKPSADVKQEISIEQDIVSELVPHIKEVNNVENTGVMTVHTRHRLHGCTLCSRTFANEFSLNRHILLTHSAGMLCHCTICDGAYNDRTSLQRQMLSHSRGTLPGCKECSGGFSQRISLEGTAEAPFSCQGCKQRQNFVRHVAREKPYTCADCKRGFSTRGSLRNHMITHRGVRPYSCKQCNHGFHRLGNLREHILVHFREIRSRESNSISNGEEILQRPIVVHSGETSFRCNVCYSTFTQRSMLGAHMQNHFGVSHEYIH